MGWGERLRNIEGAVDLYNDHSVIKLIALTYWVGIFVPIVKRKLVDQFGYSMVYIDTMGGSGVTETRRKGDCFAGSCPAAMIAANKRGHPFDGVIAVEIESAKAAALERRLLHVRSETRVLVLNKPLQDVSLTIQNWFEKKHTSLSFIDPQALQGMDWEGIAPILSLKGDTLVTWFEQDAFRVRAAALTPSKSSEADARRMDNLFGDRAWRDASTPERLTDVFCRRVEKESAKLRVKQFVVSDRERGRYKLLLFAGQDCPPNLPDKWLAQMQRRFPEGVDIATLVDKKKGRAKALEDFA
jgi:three-Cys-motif partner protein